MNLKDTIELQGILKGVGMATALWGILMIIMESLNIPTNPLIRLMPAIGIFVMVLMIGYMAFDHNRKEKTKKENR